MENEDTSEKMPHSRNQRIHLRVEGKRVRDAQVWPEGQERRVRGLGKKTTLE